MKRTISTLSEAQRAMLKNAEAGLPLFANLGALKPGDGGAYGVMQNLCSRGLLNGDGSISTAGRAALREAGAASAPARRCSLPGPTTPRTDYHPPQAPVARSAGGRGR